MFFLQSILAKQQRISSFSTTKKQKRKNKDGVTDVSLQSIWAKQQRISSFSSSKKQKREILKRWAVTFWVKQFMLK